MFCSEEERGIFKRALIFWHFSPGDKIENCPAQFLAVCWIVHVDFEVHRLRDGFSVGNALLLGQSLPAFIGHNLDKIETERFSKEAICSSLFRCSSRTVRLSFALFLFFLDFAIGSFLQVVFHRRRSCGLKATNLILKRRHRKVCG